MNKRIKKKVAKRRKEEFLKKAKIIMSYPGAIFPFHWLVISGGRIVPSYTNAFREKLAERLKEKYGVVS